MISIYCVLGRSFEALRINILLEYRRRYLGGNGCYFLYLAVGTKGGYELELGHR